MNSTVLRLVKQLVSCSVQVPTGLYENNLNCGMTSKFCIGDPKRTIINKNLQDLLTMNDKARVHAGQINTLSAQESAAVNKGPMRLNH